jgi:hypothetical protein
MSVNPNDGQNVLTNWSWVPVELYRERKRRVLADVDRIGECRPNSHLPEHEVAQSVDVACSNEDVQRWRRSKAGREVIVYGGWSYPAQQKDGL